MLRSTTTVPKMKQRIKLAEGEVQRLEVYGMETERFIRLSPALGPAVENVEAVHFEASCQQFSHIANAEVLNCFPCILALCGVRHTARMPSEKPMMSHKLRELYISSFDPVWGAFLSHPFPRGASCLQWRSPFSYRLTKMLIGMPRLEILFLDGTITPDI